MNNIKSIFAKNLQKEFAKSGKTQLEVSKYVGVSPAAMNLWVQGKNIPRMDKIEKLSECFDIDIDALLVENYTQSVEKNIYRYLKYFDELQKNELLKRAVELDKLKKSEKKEN